MKFTDCFKKLVKDFLVIFAVIVITITLLRQIFAPDVYLRLRDIYNYMICAVVGDLPSLIFYTKKDMTEKEMRLRIIIHFAVLEAALLTIANVFGWVSGITNMLFLAVQIAIIYGIVRLILWMDDKKAANSINEKLRALKNETCFDSEE
ncbi:MAG: DUF3021 domain-containing protein [Pseudomonadota bacterium]